MRPAPLPHLAKGGPEQQAIEAGEIDAILDHGTSNVILLPAARSALQKAAGDAMRNRLLAALPRAECQRLLAPLELVTLRCGEVLHEPGMPVAHLYFPVDCVIALLAASEGPEIGMVGYEGMVGIPLALGADVSSSRALVQSGGSAVRIKADHFKEAFARCPQLQQALYRSADAKLAQARQTIACNRLHLSEARLARWLLMTADRLRSDQLLLTQGLLADVLGLRRATVTEAAGSLQRRRLIGYARGMIRILDRAGLETAACACYASIDGANVRVRTDAPRSRD